MTDASRPVVLVGLIRLRDHCAFTWEEPASEYDPPALTPRSPAATPSSQHDPPSRS